MSATVIPTRPSPTMCAPAVRTVVIRAFLAKDPAPGDPRVICEVYPVLAIIARGIDEKGPKDASGRFYPIYDALVVDPGRGLCEATLAFGGPGNAWECLPCPWHPDDDDDRFEVVQAELRKKIFAPPAGNPPA